MFQEKIFQGLLTDHRWASQMFEVMKPSFFDVKSLAYLASRYFSYYEKYKCFPTMPLLLTIIKEGLSENDDTILKDQIIIGILKIKEENFQDPTIGTMIMLIKRTGWR